MKVPVMLLIYRPPVRALFMHICCANVACGYIFNNAMIVVSDSLCAVFLHYIFIRIITLSNHACSSNVSVQTGCNLYGIYTLCKIVINV